MQSGDGGQRPQRGRQERPCGLGRRQPTGVPPSGGRCAPKSWTDSGPVSACSSAETLLSALGGLYATVRRASEKMRLEPHGVRYRQPMAAARCTRGFLTGCAVALLSAGFAAGGLSRRWQA